MGVLKEDPNAEGESSVYVEFNSFKRLSGLYDSWLILYNRLGATVKEDLKSIKLKIQEIDEITIKSPHYAYKYSETTGERWADIGRQEVEEVIKQDPYLWDEYKDQFNIID